MRISDWSSDVCSSDLSALSPGVHDQYPASAQQVSGPARAADGDSLDLSGISVRLFGVDAPELAQSCERGGASWACGKQAASKLASLVPGTSVMCEQKDIEIGRAHV